jgi:hypothetical protein
MAQCTAQFSCLLVSSSSALRSMDFYLYVSPSNPGLTQHTDSCKWIAPTIALAPIAFGIFFIFESVYSVTCDCYGAHSSSAIAGQGFFRNTLGAVAPLFANQFFHNVGSQYAGLILALVASMLSVLPFVMFKYGHLLREKSKLAQTFD